MNSHLDDSTFLERHVLTVLGVVLALGAVLTVWSRLAPVLETVTTALR